MAQNNQCKLEYYFTRARIEQLLNENPDATGIIICQEIKVRQTADDEKLGVVEITARADNPKRNSRAVAQNVSGCPYPPGCGK